MRSRFIVRSIVWAALYLFFILGPLFALLAGSHPPARDFWTEFSAAIGYAGLAMMGLQFGLTARLRFVTEPWGEDVIYHFHRQMSLIAVGLVVAHPIILFVIQPERLVLLNSFTAPWRARFAALSTYSLIALVVMALWRVKLNVRYVEAGAVDLLCPFLDRSAALHPHHQALFYAPQAIPRRGSAQGARRFLDSGDATGWTCRVSFQTRPVRLAHDGKHPV